MPLGVYPRKPPIERFLARLAVTDSCWLWTGFRGKNGYGQFYTGKKSSPHRFSYEWFVGPIPEGFQIDHLCRVRSCCNPDHLEAVTPGENIRRGETGKWKRDKTHCKYGHPFDEANTKWYRGCRECRACIKQRNDARFPHIERH